MSINNYNTLTAFAIELANQGLKLVLGDQLAMCY